MKKEIPGYALPRYVKEIDGEGLKVLIA